MGPDAQTLSPDTRAAMVVDAMTIDDQLAFLNLRIGRDQQNILGGFPAYCIPAFILEDGPNGNISAGSYALPASIATAATFDPTAAHDYGAALALAARVKGQTAVQAPVLNLAVLPTWGRIAETFGEDPFLAGLLGEAETKGIVENGTNVIIKHLSMYTHERNRGGANMVIDDQTRQEVFEAPFRRVVAADDPLGVMCAYGTVNQIANCADADLVARYRSWGGTGFFRTDLKAAFDPVAPLQAGVSLFKPSLKDRMLAAISTGAISADLISSRVREVLTALFKHGLMDHPPTISATRADATTQSVAIATKIANESIVLLKNTGVLPLSSTLPSLAILGSAAALSPTYVVGGSAFVPVKQPVGFAQALTSALRPLKPVLQPALPTVPGTILLKKQPGNGLGETITTSTTLTVPARGRYLADLTATYGNSSANVRIDGQRYGWVDVLRGDGIRHTTWVMTLDPGVHRVDIIWKSLGSSPVFTMQNVEGALSLAATTARSVDVPVVFVAATSSEDYDHESLGLPGFQDALIQTVALANPKTVVVLESARPLAMPWLPLVSAVVDTWLIGQIGGTPLANVLTGLVNPSGHLPMTFPATFGNSVSGDAITQVQQDGSEVLVKNDGTHMSFGMHYFRSKHLVPLFPFGFGLSYTSFSAKDLRVNETPAGWNVSALVTNTGNSAGRAVLQGYVTYPAGLGEDSLQLKAIGSVILAPGATVRLVMNLDRASLQIPRNGNWSVPTGTYAMSVGWSSNELPLTTNFTIQ